MYCNIKVLLLLSVSGLCVFAELPNSCDSPVYCYGDLLKTVQLARLFPDSKTFVDKSMNRSPNVTLSLFHDLMSQTGNNPTRDQIDAFVKNNFNDTDELEPWTPPDWNSDPPVLATISDPNYKKWARDLVALWLTLARKVSPKTSANPDQSSLIPLPNGFIIPGGRFKEIYYWDTYWIIQGLLISGMTETVRGVIDNLLSMVKRFGHVPNGSRVYYIQRSQPPLLSAMAANYLEATNDIVWLRQNLHLLEEEINFWMKNRTVKIKHYGKTYMMARYNAESNGPRPESYAEDYNLAAQVSNEEDKQQFYTELKSAAESGWDFSGRWYRNVASGELSSLATTDVIPVDLNAFLCGAMKHLSAFNKLLNNPHQAENWQNLASELQEAIENVLWSPMHGVWFDFDIAQSKRRVNVYPSNITPLWTNCVDIAAIRKRADAAYAYLKKANALSHPGGIPTSLNHTGEQWDYPNAWAPEQGIVIQAFARWGSRRTKKGAERLAATWVHSNYKGWNDDQAMFEKYDSEIPGKSGGGGEYVPQAGFGWTNGVIFELLKRYGSRLTSYRNK